MTDWTNEQLEMQLQAASQALRYPPTPDIARAVTRRLEAHPGRSPTLRLAWVLAIALIVLASLLAVPTVRAQILEFLQIGVIRIFLVESTPTPTSLPPTSTTVQSAVGIPTLPRPKPTTSPTSSPRPILTPVASVTDLAGETTLEAALQQADFPVMLPAYPPDLGAPDRVFLQDLSGQVLVLVWLDPADPDNVRLSLHQYVGRDNLTGLKYNPPVVRSTFVNGQQAVWATGPYFLELRNGQSQMVRLIEGHVLIWADDGVTYRIETDMSLEEAIRIAESLKPFES
jgi:hypothetical protein